MPMCEELLVRAAMNCQWFMPCSFELNFWRRHEANSGGQIWHTRKPKSHYLPGWSTPNLRQYGQHELKENFRPRFRVLEHRSTSLPSLSYPFGCSHLWPQGLLFCSIGANDTLGVESNLPVMMVNLDLGMFDLWIDVDASGRMFYGLACEPSFCIF